jgi:hypothetical protein
MGLGNVYRARTFIAFQFFDFTHNRVPPKTRSIPSQVLRDMTLPSTYHSPKTVKRKAMEFVIGTVRESSITEFGAIRHRYKYT